MGMGKMFAGSTLAKYVQSIKNSPRELICNRHLLLTAALYAMAGVPLTWDQGSSSVVPSLPGFAKAFGITSATNPTQVANFISLVYIGCGVGALGSFFINDRIGRLWSFRLYMCVWIVGQLMATASSGHLGVLYTARIVSGLGIGPLTVTGPVSIVEVAPTEIRGLLAVWFSIAMLLSLTVSVFVVYACFLHVAASHLQYRIVFFAPTIAMALVIACSFLLYESPRWLMLVGRREEAAETLVALRGLPADHPRVASELEDIAAQIAQENGDFESDGSSRAGILPILRETFCVKANLRRAIQACLSYALAQLSGANSVTSYLVPILSLIGVGGGTQTSLFMSGMYSMAKFFFTVIASFFFIDALGRRRSLFIGITIQMISDIYIGVFIKYRQEGTVNQASSQAAIAAIFLHGFGYAVGLLVLPYVFGAELWPNKIRSFGAAFSQAFHWIFYFAVNKGVPSLLNQTHNWGAFLFFAGWCFVSLVYVFFCVPETAGFSMEKIDQLFETPWWKAHRQAKRLRDEEVVLESATLNSNLVDNRSSTSKGPNVKPHPIAQEH